MEQVKLCRDCRFYRKGWLGERYALCSHPNLVNPGIGEPDEYCQIQRDHPAGGPVKCGEEGKLWEPHPPRSSLWQRLKERLTHA